MPESVQTRLARWRFNLFPAYWGTGGRIRYISSDWTEVHVELPLTWRTRNYVGTLFGGSIYGVVDPLYMVMFIKILGPRYVVWDKAAAIRFLRPGRDTLFARFRVEAADVDSLRAELETARSVERVYGVQLVDRAGRIHATVDKTLYFRKRDQTDAGERGMERRE